MKSHILIILALSLITTVCQAQTPVLYGMTIQGGDLSAQAGNIFRFPVGGLWTDVHDFGIGAGDGQGPWGSLVRANNGLLYGMTKLGGASHVGVLFSFNTVNDSEKVLHSFTGSPDGAAPYGSLIQAGNGLLYGMVTGGGAGNTGCIISYNPVADTELVVYSFAGGTGDGEYPYGSLIQANDSLLYGMTQRGGVNDSGVIFSFNISSGVETKLHDFGGNGDGTYPWGSLMQAKNGLLYGMTIAGGSNNVGALFSFNITTHNDSVLHSFSMDSTDGRVPYGSLIQAKDSLLYGMTEGGGKRNGGMMFSYNIATGGFSDLHDFAGGTVDGTRPEGTLMQASDGKLYGMTAAGGSIGDGILFSYSLPDSAYNIYNFTGPLGYLPYFGALIEVDTIATSGIMGMAVSGNLPVSPNPSAGLFSVTLPGTQSNYPVEVYNLLGEKIYQASLSNSHNVINLLAQPNGMYFIYLKTSDGVQTAKVMLAR